MKNVLFKMDDELHARLKQLVRKHHSTMPFVACQLLERALDSSELVDSIQPQERQGRKTSEASEEVETEQAAG